MQIIYDAEYGNLDYDEVNNYEYASAHPLKYTRVSFRLLQLATSLPEYDIKLWSLLPNGSNRMVHVPLSGMRAMYYFFRRAHANNLNVPLTLIDNQNFITVSAFDYLYFRPIDKRNLWNAIFNLPKLEQEVFFFIWNFYVQSLLSD